MEDCKDSAQGWSSKEDAVKQPLVPAAIPCNGAGTGAQLLDMAKAKPEGPDAADPAAAATSTDVQPDCTQTDFRVISFPHSGRAMMQLPIVCFPCTE